MVREGNQRRPRRAPVVRVPRRRRAVQTRPASSSRRGNRATSSYTRSQRSIAARTNLAPAEDSARASRAERRELLQRLAEAERRADAVEAKRNATAQELGRRLAEADRRASAAETERDDIERKAEATAKERDDLLAKEKALYDEGTELWQNVWDAHDVSQVLDFPTLKSAVCGSVEYQGGNDMPGVHALGAIDNGRTTQSIWMKGRGYTLVGLVTSEEEKLALRRHAGDDWEKVPFMTPVYSADDDDRAGDTFTIEVDMIERRAELYISDKDSTRQLQPHTVWEGLPEKVWVAIAFKRNTPREAVLVPCIHWNIKATEDM